MTGTQITSSASMTGVADSVSDLIVNYSGAVNRLYDLGQELDGMWDGDANKTFMAKFAGDRAKFDDVVKILNLYVDTLRTNIGIYEKAEADAAQVAGTRKYK